MATRAPVEHSALWKKRFGPGVRWAALDRDTHSRGNKLTRPRIWTGCASCSTRCPMIGVGSENQLETTTGAPLRLFACI
ncbi:MAG: hypothetical protein R6V85_07875 [Polyangia bacterium]